MSSFKLHPRPSFKRSYSDLSRSTTPIPPDIDGEDLRAELPDFLRQSQDDIKQKFSILVNTDRQRLESFHEGDDPLSEPDPDHRWAVDVSREVAQRNRYCDVQPWSRTRIRLRVQDGELDYINASPIKLLRTDGEHELRYIAAQGPKANGVDHFWQMVWHECSQTAVVIMLTQLNEGMREKCFQYYPSEAESARPRTPLSRSSSRAGTPPAGNVSLSPARSQLLSPTRLANFSWHQSSDPSTATQPILPINLTSSSGEPLQATLTLVDTSFDDMASATVRKLSLTCGDEARIVYHLLFTGWPDYGVPQGQNRAAMMSLIRLSQEKNEEEGRECGPRVVHCSAGVGRTGTFIALEHLLGELESGAWDNWHGGDNADRYMEFHSYNGHEMDVFSADDDSQDQNQNHDPDESSSTPSSPSPSPSTLPSTSNLTCWPDPVFDTVSRLREQRAHMVQAPAQYLFIYEILAEEWIKRRRRLLEEKKHSLGPSPKAMRLGMGLKKILHLGRDRDRDRDKDKANKDKDGGGKDGGKEKVGKGKVGGQAEGQGDGTATDGYSTDGTAGTAGRNSQG